MTQFDYYNDGEFEYYSICIFLDDEGEARVYLDITVDKNDPKYTPGLCNGDGNTYWRGNSYNNLDTAKRVGKKQLIKFLAEVNKNISKKMKELR